MELCEIEGCSLVRKYGKKGWCQTHYHRWWRTGTTDLTSQVIDMKAAGYRAAHVHVTKLWGKAKEHPCWSCGATANEWAYDGTDISEKITTQSGYPVSFSVWPEFYMPMCFPCHRLRDAGARSARRTHFGCGHLREGNSYTPPSKPNSSECVACRKTRSATRYKTRKTRREHDERVQADSVDD